MNDATSRLEPPVPPGSNAVDLKPPRPSNAVVHAPTSFSQRRLWLLDQLLPVRAIYNVGTMLRLAGDLDVDALRRALNELLRRHEALRTRFVLVEAGPIQDILPEATLLLTSEDLCALPPTERENEARRRAADEAQTEFNLDRGPIFRARLLRLAPREHWLLLTMHHIVSDGWSAAVLAREVSALYAAFRRGEASPLPELPVQYADFAAWQREWLQGEVLERQLAYWRGALADLPVLELPTDRARATTPSYRGGRVTFEIDAMRTRALKEFSRREKSTPFMTLLASFHILLYRYTGQEDVAVGAPIAGRRRPELEGLIGFFVNTLVLRGDLSGDPAFREYLRRVRELALEAYAHQDLPFEKLVEELAPRRELSRNPLFQAAFAFHNTAPIEWSLPGLEVERLEGIAPVYTTFDLTLSVREADGALQGRITYASDLFDAGTIERMARQWLTMLDHIVDDPECRVSRLRLMDEVERACTLVAGNNARAPLAVEPAVPAFEQSAPNPDAPAGQTGGRTPDAMAMTPSADCAAAGYRGLVPVSFAQDGLWFLQRLTPESPVYNVVHAWRIDGALDLGALEQALRFVINRHDALRTTFVLSDGKLWQRIVESVDVTLSVVSVTGADPGTRETEALRLAREAGRRPFDFPGGPLLRAFALRADEHRFWLVMVMHHAIRDGASTAIFCRELSRAYNAFLNGTTPDLAPLPAQYTDYAVWQRESLKDAHLDALIAYWRARLAGAPAALDLPTERRRPQLESHAGARASFIVDAALVDALRTLARREAATLHMALLAAYQVLLGHYANQEDILVGAPVAGRGRPEFQSVFGCFVNTVIHRGDLSGDPSFRTLLQRTRDSAAQAYRHQDLPFERLVDALAPRRDPGRHPLMQAMFTLQDAFDSCPPPLVLDGADAIPVDVYLGNSKVDLTLFMVRDGPRLLGAVEYATDLFTPSWAQRLARQFVTLLESIVGDPDCPISRLPLMDDAERRRALVSWNQTGAPSLGQDSISALFSAQVRRAPHAIAVRQGELALSYAELDRRATALAHRLRDLDIAPGARVALCMERSVEEIVAVLGILKAGSAYVPLDPSHPPERLAAVLRDAGASAVLITPAAERALARSRASSARPVIVLDGADDVDARPELELACSGDDPAYVIYTSGSTGEPKGVVVPQRAVLRLVCDTDYVQLGAGDVVAHLSNPAFDAATFEIWGALLNGACLVVIPRETVLSPTELAATFDRHGVTTLFLTTALFNVVARDAPRALAGRTVLFGGEAVDPRWVAAALSDGNPGRLLHVYGPTEATTFATWHEVRAVDAAVATLPIGRPIAHTEVYVLDRNGEPVPCGIPGEIHIGGPGLATGYLGRPDLTAERFVAHPFGREPGERLYRTGDRARYRSDGAIEFLGRIDAQVKIRGHRVEPGEVEVALRALPQVRDAVVVVHGDTAETRRLTAYVVPSAGGTPTPAELWRELRRGLPEYMLPGAIVLLAALPLTPNGKLDRRALPDPIDLAEQRTGFHMPPQNPLQQMIAAIWEELLGIRDVGVRDSFFEIGGHSLLAAQMIDAVERACGVKIPLTMLFTQPTIADLAAAIRSRTAAFAASITALNTAGSSPPLFFLHGDFSGGGFYCIPLSRALGDEQPFYAVHPHGLDGHEVPESIEAMAAERLHALRRMRPTGPYFLGGHCNGAFVALEIARQLVEQGEEVPMVVLLDAKAPQGPPSAGKRNRSPQAAATRGAINPARSKRDVFARYRAAVASYVPAPYSGRIVVLRSENTRDVRPDLGWSVLGVGVETYTIPGDHHSSITRHVAETAARIRACIEAVGSP